MKFLYPLFTLILLPLIALAWLFSKMIVPFKRSSKNGMIFLDREGKRVLFSPYFEFETILGETSLLVKTIITLSNDEIKKDLQAPLTEKAKSANRRKHIFRETTLLLINQGEKPIKVTPKYIEIDAETISKLDDVEVLIAAGHYHECEHSMAKDLQDRQVYDVKVILEVEGVMQELSGKAERLTIQELKEKYPVEA